MRKRAFPSAKNCDVGRARAGRGHIKRGRRMAAVLAAAAIAVFVCLIGVTGAAAAPACPGSKTGDGLACCAPGATPTTDDACQLSGGGQAASCPLAQLTSSGTCCPLGATPQADGSCQSNGFTVDGCALGQLDKGGLTCCASGQVPQADGSCKLTSAANQSTSSATAGISSCPSGFVYQQATRNCTGAPTGCAAPAVTIPGDSGSFNVPQAPVTGNAVSGVTNTPFILGCCPWPSQQITPTSACYEGGATGLVAVPPAPPVCPPGSVPNNFWNTGIYFCVAKPSCPPHFHVDATTGQCDFDPIAFNANALKSISLNDAGPCKNNSAPRRAFVGDDACVTVAAAAQTLLQNTTGPSHAKPDGTCLPGYAWRLYGPSDHVCVSTIPPPAPPPINCAAGFARDDKGKCGAVAGNCRRDAVQIDGKCIDLPKAAQSTMPTLPELKIPPGGSAASSAGASGSHAGPTIECAGYNEVLIDGFCEVPTNVCAGGAGPDGQCQCSAGATSQPGFQCCPYGTMLNASGQCQPFCPTGATDGESAASCALGVLPNLINGQSYCIDGTTPASQPTCLLQSPLVTGICPAGWTKQPNPQFGNIVMCTPTPLQASSCEKQGMQVGIDGTCQSICTGGVAYPIAQCCPAGQIGGPNGRCECPPGTFQIGNQCLRHLDNRDANPQAPATTPSSEKKLRPCEPNATRTGPNTCVCNAGFVEAQNGACVVPCAFGQVMQPDGACTCPNGQPPGPGGVCSCPPGQSLQNGACVCQQGEKPTSDGTCVAACPAGSTALMSGICCANSQITKTGKCCLAGTTPQANGECSGPSGTPAKPNAPTQNNNSAAPATPCGVGFVERDGRCVEAHENKKPNSPSSETPQQTQSQVQPTQAPSAPPTVCQGSNGFEGQCQCTAGYAGEPGFVCCPFGTMAQHGNRQCQPICPNGATDPASVKRCEQGYNPVPVNGIYVCLNGATVQSNGGSCDNQSPLAAATVCPAGWTKVADPNGNANAICKPAHQEQDCQKSGKDVGLDGTCQTICPSGNWPFPIYQCCPDGATLKPDGSCPPPPSSKVCAVGEVYVDGKCRPAPKPEDKKSETSSPTAPTSQQALPQSVGPVCAINSPNCPSQTTCVNGSIGLNGQCQCNAGASPETVIQCCPQEMVLGPSGKCQSPCPGGQSDATSLQFCFLGFNPVPGSNGALNCLDGSMSNPPAVLQNGTISQQLACISKSPYAQAANCPFGWALAPEPLLGGAVLCQPTGQQAPNPCPSGALPFLSNVCCPLGMIAEANGQCETPPPPPPPNTSPPPPSANGCPASGNVIYCEPQPNGACPAGSFQSAGGGCQAITGATCAFGPALCCPLGSNPNWTTNTCGQPSPPPSCQARGGNMYCAPQGDGTCPQGTTKSGSACLAIGATCPTGAEALCCSADSLPNFATAQCCQNGRCGQPGPVCAENAELLPSGICCPQSQVTSTKQCCLAGQSPMPNGSCCSSNQIRDGKCAMPPTPPKSTPATPTPPPPPRVEPQQCPAGSTRLPNGSCCPNSEVQDGGCVAPNPPPPPPPPPTNCAPGYSLGADGMCHRIGVGIICPPHTGEIPSADGRSCVCPPAAQLGPTGACQCGGSGRLAGPAGCGPQQIPCAPAQKTTNGQCCPDGTTAQGNSCSANCQAGQKQWPDGTCSSCQPGQQLEPNGNCGPILTPPSGGSGCGPGRVFNPQTGGCMLGLVPSQGVPVTQPSTTQPTPCAPGVPPGTAGCYEPPPPPVIPLQGRTQPNAPNPPALMPFVQTPSNKTTPTPMPTPCALGVPPGTNGCIAAPVGTPALVAPTCGPGMTRVGDRCWRVVPPRPPCPPSGCGTGKKPEPRVEGRPSRVETPRIEAPRGKIETPRMELPRVQAPRLAPKLGTSPKPNMLFWQRRK